MTNSENLKMLNIRDRSIHVINDRDLENSMIGQLIPHWQKAGAVVTLGPVTTIETDIALMHFDKTVIPEAVIPDNPHNHPFLNASVTDISKRLFSTLSLNAESDWDGQVIIKSNLNCFGEQEWKTKIKSPLNRLQRKIAKKYWRLAKRLPPNDYPVLTSLGDIPDWVWMNNDIIVEKFMPERDGDYYCLRGWVFFGDRGYCYRLYSNDPVVKMGGVIKYEWFDQPPQDLIDFRTNNGFDFGKFDYVEIEGEVILLDINKTPSLKAESDSPRVRDLAQGINSFL